MRTLLGNTMNIEEIRRDTEGVNQVLHFNNAGSSLVPKSVLSAQLEYLKQEAQIGGYEVAKKHKTQLDKFYEVAAKLLNARPNEIGFSNSATDSWTRLFHSIAWKEGDEILTGHTEYASNYIAFLQVAKRHGVVITPIENDHYGAISTEALESAIKPNTKLIALTHMPTNGGLVNPAEEVGQIANRHNILYLLDACQTVGQYPLDVQKLGCDMLTATGRKYLRGPRGTGLLYIKHSLLKKLDPFLLDLFSAEWQTLTTYTTREDARKFESFEYNCAAKLGLQKAISYAMSIGMDAIWDRVQRLAQVLREEAWEVAGAKSFDLGLVKGGIVSLNIPGVNMASVSAELQGQGINTSVIVPSGTRLDMDQRKLSTLLRASVHYYNTEEEIQRFCKALAHYN